MIVAMWGLMYFLKAPNPKPLNNRAALYIYFNSDYISTSECRNSLATQNPKQ